MEYLTVKELALKWNISERRIRKLIADKRINGVIKKGKYYLIPNNLDKPIDKRNKITDNIKFDVDINLINDINDLMNKLDKKRPFNKGTLKSLKENFNLQFTYNSNAIEGNTLTLSETKVVLEGITIGGKTVREHLEAINHKEAMFYLEEIIRSKVSLSEIEIRNIHRLILKEIDNENAGKYRNCNVLISGAKHVPPDYTIVKQKMEELMYKYNNWCKEYNPLIVSALLHGEFVKIHPFIDGNGRTARLLMNFEIIRNGYVPVIIKNESRVKYYDYLDKAHISGNYTDFINLIMNIEKEALNFYLKIM